MSKRKRKSQSQPPPIEWAGGPPEGVTLYCDAVAAPASPETLDALGLLRAESEPADGDDRRIEFRFSTANEIDHFWFFLTLDHDPGSVRLDRFRNGLGPILVDHSTRDQIGVIERAIIGPDRTGLAIARLGQSARAGEILQDIRDGIRKGVSVGFIVHRAVLEEMGDDVTKERFRAVDWEPIEVSVVPTPADINATILQSLATSERDFNQMPENTTDTVTQTVVTEPPAAPVAPAQPTEEERRSIIHAEQHRQNEIIAIGRKFGMDTEADAARASGMSLDAFSAQVMQSYRPDTPQAAHAGSTPEATVTAVDYTRMRMPKNFRGVTAQQDAYQAGQWFRAVLYKDPQADEWCRANGIPIRIDRAASESVNTAGGFLVPTILENAIIDLREQWGVFRRLARPWPMASDNVIIPVAVSGLTANPVGENEEITESQKVWSNVELTARKWGILTKYSSELAEDAVIQLADDLVSEIARAYAEAEDDAGFNGDGTASFHGIQGIRTKLIDGNHDGSIVDAAAGINTFEEVTATGLTNMMGALPMVPGIQPAWHISQVGRSLVFDRLAIAAGGNTIQTLIDGRVTSTYLSYPIEISQKMPTTTGDQAATIAILFGDLRMGSLFGDRRGMTIAVSTERYFELDQIGIRGTERFDINNHGLGDATVAGPIVGLRLTSA